jgi:excisionase family DNA binding protein
MEEWLTIYEAAEAVNYDPDYLRKLIRASKIKARKWGNSWQVNRVSLFEYAKESEKKGGKRGPKKVALSVT